MFTIEQIEELHERLGSAKTLAEYVRSLAGIGVVRYVCYVSDGHSEYFGHDGRRVMSQPAHDQLPVAAKATGKRCWNIWGVMSADRRAIWKCPGPWLTAASRGGLSIRTR